MAQSALKGVMMMAMATLRWGLRYMVW